MPLDSCAIGWITEADASSKPLLRIDLSVSFKWRLASGPLGSDA